MMNIVWDCVLVGGIVFFLAQAVFYAYKACMALAEWFREIRSK